MKRRKVYHYINNIIFVSYMVGLYLFHFISYHDYKLLSIVTFIISITITIFLYNKYWLAYKISKENLKQKFVYHLLDKNKLDKVTKSKNKTLYQVELKRTKGILNNYSGAGREFTYFHTDFKEYSYFFNHFLKKIQPVYMLIIQVNNLDENLLYSRNIDKSLLYADEYIGEAKVINISKMKFIKKATKQSCELFLIDSLMCLMVGNTLMQFLAILFGYLTYVIRFK
jgi:hypothetical protein